MVDERWLRERHLEVRDWKAVTNVGIMTVDIWKNQQEFWNIVILDCILTYIFNKQTENLERINLRKFQNNMLFEIDIGWPIVWSFKRGRFITRFFVNACVIMSSEVQMFVKILTCFLMILSVVTVFLRLDILLRNDFINIEKNWFPSLAP